jgi:hypothetical protein
MSAQPFVNSVDPTVGGAPGIGVSVGVGVGPVGVGEGVGELVTVGVGVFVFGARALLAFAEFKLPAPKSSTITSKADRIM